MQRRINFNLTLLLLQICLDGEKIKHITRLKITHEFPKDDLSVFNLSFVSKKGKKGLVERISFKGKALYRISFDTKSVVTLTEDEYLFFMPYYSDNINGNLDRLKWIAGKYKAALKEKIRISPLLHKVIRDLLSSYQKFFHDGTFEKTKGYSRKHFAEFTDPRIHEFPEIVYVHTNHNKTKADAFRYVLN